MLETFIQLDSALTVFINHFHSPFLDALMIAISGRMTWIPLYAIILWLMYKSLGWKTTGFFLLIILINLTLTDQISVWMKNHFLRLRPCHNPNLTDLLHLADGCGGKFGFVSSHAANTMGLAVLCSLLLTQNWLKVSLFTFAFLNSYSRVYLAKHYVGDVVGGMFLGLVIGWLVYHLASLALKKLKLRE